MTSTTRNTFILAAAMFATLKAKELLGRLPAGLDEAETGRLDWHIQNAALAISGTAQLASYNGLVDFVASHYAALLQVPQGDDLNDLTVSTGLKGALGPIRKADSLPALHAAYKALAENIAAFLDSAAAPAHRIPSAEQAAQAARRRAIADAIWRIRRQDEDREDQDLDDLPTSHSVWAEADAVLVVLAREPSPQ
jgi:hypothetical protein